MEKRIAGRLASSLYVGLHSAQPAADLVQCGIGQHCFGVVKKSLVCKCKDFGDVQR